MGLFRAEVGLLQLYLLRQSTRPTPQIVSPAAKSRLGNRENGRGHILAKCRRHSMVSSRAKLLVMREK